jgi:hypothetical protein
LHRRKRDGFAETKSKSGKKVQLIFGFSQKKITFAVPFSGKYLKVRSSKG